MQCDLNNDRFYLGRLSKKKLRNIEQKFVLFDSQFRFLFQWSKSWNILLGVCGYGNNLLLSLQVFVNAMELAISSDSKLPVLVCQSIKILTHPCSRQCDSGSTRTTNNHNHVSVFVSYYGWACGREWPSTTPWKIIHWCFGGSITKETFVRIVCEIVCKFIVIYYTRLQRAKFCTESKS